MFYLIRIISHYLSQIKNFFEFETHKYFLKLIEVVELSFVILYEFKYRNLIMQFDSNYMYGLILEFYVCIIYMEKRRLF